ncbi:MAG: efflux RND transporter periplasmic adaptor subunit [Porphyromonadaceae bacterium]|nr:efflux RND transporter periplasmic adaptor subunit [Porphyromonadaceae bacterium]
MKLKFIIIAAGIIGSIILFSCSRKNKDNHIHEPGENLQLVSYGSDYELFAEAHPFAVNHDSEILAHFTHLKNFKPLEEGSVTASLSIDTEIFEQTLEKPNRPGIYKFNIKPEIEGEATLTFRIKTPEKVSEITVNGINVFSDIKKAIHAAEDEAKTSINTASFTKEQSWKIDFATDVTEKELFGQVIRTVGQIQPAIGDERVITAKTGGIVVFRGDNIVEGNAVSAGQALFTIDGSGMADNNLSVRQAEAQNEYNRAKAEYERKAELAKDRIVSESELLRAKTEMDNAQANYDNLRQNFSSGRQSVSSPISGYITNVLVRNGEFASAGQPVLSVSQNKNLFVKAEIRPKYFNTLNNISTVTFRTMENKRSFTLEELNGRIVSFGKSADLSNPLLPVVFQISNRAGLIPGSFIELFIKTQSQTEKLTVDNEAIVEEMGKHFVYVQVTPELFEKRPVTIAATDGIRTEITVGLSEGERIITKGAIFVKLAQAAGAIDPHEGHVH